MLTGAVALKEDDLQFISNQAGDVPAHNPGGLGLYFRDTRYLNRFEMLVNGMQPVFLSNSVEKHYIATFQFVNPPLILADGTRVQQQTISIRRSRFVSDTGLFERVGFFNCNHFEAQIEVVLGLDADFKDIFTVRGFKMQRMAGQIGIEFGGDALIFSYQGRDGVRRLTEATFSLPPEAISAREVRFVLALKPHKFDALVIRVRPCIGNVGREPSPDFESELERLAGSYRDWERCSTHIATDNELFNRELLRASRYDVRTLIERTPWGLVPDAGIPWYAVPFGRDAIITSLQTLTYNPAIAEGTLRFLAAHQGEKLDEEREEEPGKIMHELRRGELARLREVPHTPYFGTVDATPLFLILLVETMNWLGSDELFREMLPAAVRALEWIDRWGDCDGDGYVEYLVRRPGGVANQGWKDSNDAVQYEDGQSARQPLALVEVQGYVYQAKMGMARLLRTHGDVSQAERLEQEALALKTRFNHDFWMEDEQFFAQALDRDKTQIRSVTSNPGHCLWSGICDADKADAVAERLLAPDMFSGWGIRTLSRSSPNYNPMSYHNGSVWPHDSALIALGLRRCGHHEEGVRLVQAMVEAGFHFSDARLPELFCGFERDQRFNSSPAAYLISCSPQAWSTGSTFMMIQTILDIRPAGDGGTLHLDPRLPSLFRSLSLRNLRYGNQRLSVTVEGSDYTVEVTDPGISRVDTAAGS
jgi:glycogen debranching enzyme